MISLTYQLSTLGPALYCHIRADRHTRLRAGLVQAPHPQSWDRRIPTAQVGKLLPPHPHQLQHSFWAGSTAAHLPWCRLAQWQHMPSHHLFNSYKCPKIWAPYHLENWGSTMLIPCLRAQNPPSLCPQASCTRVLLWAKDSVSSVMVSYLCHSPRFFIEATYVHKGPLSWGAALRKMVLV